MSNKDREQLLLQETISTVLEIPISTGIQAKPPVYAAAQRAKHIAVFQYI